MHYITRTKNFNLAQMEINELKNGMSKKHRPEDIQYNNSN